MKVRISMEELISQIRQNGIFDLDEVDYAILEENGKMSIIPKAHSRQPDFRSLGIKCDDSGVMHIVISDGILNHHSLNLLGLHPDWVTRKLSSLGLKQSDVLCMTVNDIHRTVVVKLDGTMIY